jgi:tetratricopeptide (TPR) repeat protein
LIEPGGQLRLDFDAHPGEAPAEETITASMSLHKGDSLADTLPQATPEQLWEAAIELEEAGRLEEAIQLHRAALAAGGPRAENCFQLAELLYRTGDVPAARERYYMAIELDEDYVEARANLGCVLVETGQEELAVAAFHGALRVHDDYPDAHFHLARLLDDLGRPEEAKQHWQAFLRLAADSPWAEMARIRLQDEA